MVDVDEDEEAAVAAAAAAKTKTGYLHGFPFFRAGVCSCVSYVCLLGEGTEL